MLADNVPKEASLADALAVVDPRTAEQQTQADKYTEPTLDGAVDISDPTKFCERVLASREFRQYIVSGIVLGEIPPGVLTRIMDQAGWRRATDRVEHTGANGEPIKTVTEVRRIIVRPSKKTLDDHISTIERDVERSKQRTH